jgi:hypothetical protein
VAKQPHVVKIQPVVAHLSDGTDITELGIGGGLDDLERDAELSFLTPEDVRLLTELCVNASFVSIWSDRKLIASYSISSFAESFGEEPHPALASIMKTVSTGRSLHLDLGISEFSDDFAASMQSALKALTGWKAKLDHTINADTVNEPSLPKSIRFPYSRHSSYAELCHFVETFSPLDVWPCTEDSQHWYQHGVLVPASNDDSSVSNSFAGISIESLFGKYCSGTTYAYDEMMRSVVAPELADAEDNSEASAKESVAEQHSSPLITVFPVDETPSAKQLSDDHVEAASSVRTHKRSFEQLSDEGGAEDEMQAQDKDSQRTNVSITSHILDTHSASRHEAYNDVLEKIPDGEWNVPPLLSIDGHHGIPEKEL